MSSNKNLAFIGLGTLGLPMAGHLAQAGYRVTAYNRSPAKAQTWLELYPEQDLASSAAQAAAQADVVLLCVGQDEDVRTLLTGPQGVLESLQPGGLVIDHTTTSASLAAEMFQACNAKQVDFLDAPVSGGQQGAEQGQLTIMAGGEPAAFERGASVMRAYARAVTHMGPVGSGQMTKMVNQICVAGLLQGLAEGLHFAEKAGLDAQQVIDVIRQGAAGSWQMEHRHKTMLQGDYEHGFAVDWMRKDLGICLKQASQLGASLPLTALVDQFYAEVQNLGGGRWDTSSLLKRLQAFSDTQ